MVINLDQEKQERESLEYESLPEFVREPYNNTKSYVTAPARSERFYERYHRDDIVPTEDFAKYPPTYGEENTSTGTSKHAELETLWPGTNHGIGHNEFLPSARRSAGMYLTIGFMSGAFVALLVVWVVTLFTHNEPSVSQAAPAGNKKVVVATSTHSNLTQSAPPAAPAAQLRQKQPAQKTADNDVIPELIIPTVSSYQVQNGDTLAGIIMKTYKRVSPRLLDTICRVNGMASADKLTLGQKLNLPQYRPIRNQVATRANSSM